MSSIHFKPSSTPQPAAKLNHPQNSPFKENQVTFHLNGQHLSDFTPDGIEKFINANQNSDTKLNPEEVKAFVQQVAGNIDQVKDHAFNLADPGLGLLKNDDIQTEHIQGGFSAEFKISKGAANKQVSFVETVSVSFDLKDKQNGVKKQEGTIAKLEGQLGGLKKEHQTQTNKLTQLEKKLGEGADQQLAKLETIVQGHPEKIKAVSQKLEDLTGEETKIKASDTPEAEKTTKLAELTQKRTDLSAKKATLEKELLESKTEYTDKKGTLPHTSFAEYGTLKSQALSTEQSVKKLETNLKEEKTLLTDLKSGKVKPSAVLDKKPTEVITPTEVKKPVEVPATDKTDKVEPKPEIIKKTEVAPTELTPTEADFKKMSPEKKTSKLASLSSEDQGKLIALLSPTEKAEVKTQAETYLTNLNASTLDKSIDKKQRIQQYQSLITVLGTETPSKPDDATKVDDKTKVDPTKDVTKVEDKTEGPQTLTKRGKPLIIGGKTFTAESFKTLDTSTQFKVLMQVDSEFLQGLLENVVPDAENNKAEAKARRSEIKGYAKGLVQEYNAYVNSSETRAAVQQNGGGYVQSQASSQGEFGPLSSVKSANKFTKAEHSRALQIIHIIEMLDGKAEPTPVQAVTDSHPASDGWIAVRPDQTPREIAKEKLGNVFRVSDLFDQTLNQQMMDIMTQRRQDGKKEKELFYDEKFGSDITHIKLPSAPGSNVVLDAEVAGKASLHPEVKETP